MRLFVAVDVDQPTREAAHRLRERLVRAVPEAGRTLRWVHPDHLHLTLSFIGERESAGDVLDALAPPLAHSPFTITWGAPAWLPPRGRPRVFYVPIRDGAAAMTRLAALVADRLARLGVERDARGFTPHLTLARVRDGVDGRLCRDVDAALQGPAFAPESSVEVRDVVLYESRLSPRGPAYTALQRWLL
jgi:2'-5' RNA ligase